MKPELEETASSAMDRRTLLRGTAVGLAAAAIVATRVEAQDDRMQTCRPTSTTTSSVST
jgi:hypothetical protein